MNIHQYHRLLKGVQNRFPCPFCHRQYKINELQLLSLVPHEVSFFLNCEHCPIPVLLFVIFENSPNLKKASFNWHPMSEGITANEVLDMHNFLKNFSGDLSKYLNK